MSETRQLNTTGRILWSDYDRSRSSIIDTNQFMAEGWKVGDEKWIAFRDQMIALGKSLSAATGYEIEWFFIQSACNPFGDFSYFITQKKKPWFRRAWHRVLNNRWRDIEPKDYYPFTR